MDTVKINELKGGVILEIIVMSCSREFKVVIENDEIVILCLEEPVKVKVNKELVRVFETFSH